MVQLYRANLEKPWTGGRARSLPNDFGNGVTKIGNGVTKIGNGVTKIWILVTSAAYTRKKLS